MKLLTHDEFIQKILPPLVRLAVEVEDGRRIRLDSLCPVFSLIEKLIKINPSKAETFSADEQWQAIHLAKRLHHALEQADEVLQLDGPAAVGFAAGYLAGETCVSPLFSSDENLLADQAAMASEAAGIPIFYPRRVWEPAADKFESFRAGFTTRRDELRRHQKVTE